MLGLFFSSVIIIIFSNIPVLLFLLYIFVCFDPSICYPFPCFFVSSIYYLAFLACSILFLHHNLLLIVLLFFLILYYINVL